MKAIEFRKMELPKLQDELRTLMRELFNLRMQRGSGSEVRPHLFRQVRRDLARIRTIIGEKMKEGNAS